MRAAVYLRVSTEDQASGGTIETQRQFAESYCRLQGLTPVEVYADEAVSGTLPLERRPAGKQLLADAKARRFEVLYVYRIDRFSRSVLELLRAVETLDASGVTLRSMTEPFDLSTPLGRCILTILASFAELERSAIRERMMLGAQRVAREGRWSGGRIAYGYRTGPDGSLVIHEDEAVVIRRIFALHAEELSAMAVARLLAAERVPTWGELRNVPTGRRWSGAVVAGILHNPTYAGRRIFRSHDAIEGPAPAIVTAEEWDRAQRLLAETRTRAPSNATREYLLRGLVRCGACGHLMTGCAKKGHSYTYYRCHRRSELPAEERCRARHIPAPALEAHVWSEIEHWAAHPDEATALMAAQIREQEPEREDAEGEARRLQESIDAAELSRQRLIRLAGRGSISEAELDSHLSEVDAELLTLRTRQADCLSREERLETWQRRLVEADMVLRQLQRQIEAGGPQARRQAVETLVEEVRVEWPEDAKTPRITAAYCFNRPGVGRGDSNSKEFLFRSQNHLLPKRLRDLEGRQC